ncbi:hypothetical protein LPMP_271290 [Leishmania panamensis]|uniref:Uncharacterized protein n=1 Tax=Leishmania panamensis TaxID=5679 RepID=A0A088RUC3_LEIPA|nr:hypothetical protein LPMP_271290 [Leishmania panamensis]AIN99510.1 hypothetical protein LPMP_271290 [Leishmania panamensis]
MQSRGSYFTGEEGRLDYEPRSSRHVKERLPHSSQTHSSRVSLQKNVQPYAYTVSTYPHGINKKESRSPSRAEVTRQARVLSPPLTQHGSQVLSPSRLRYVGAPLTKRISPSDFLREACAAKSHQQSSSQGLLASLKHLKASNASPMSHESVSIVVPCAFHPLLQQALLLIEAAEVEERLAFFQEERDAFDSVIVLFSIAREIEAIRIAAFEMFHIERASRRALKRQERHERRILRLWFSESYGDALLSEEVRIIRRQSEESKSTFAFSPSHLQSKSLRQLSQDVFDVSAAWIGSPSSRKVPCSQKSGNTARYVGLSSFQPVWQRESIGNPSPTSSCDEVLHKSTRALLPKSSKSYFPHPVGSPHLLHKSSDSVNVADKFQYYREYGDHRLSSFGDIETDLEDRIARQKTLLVPGRQLLK